MYASAADPQSLAECVHVAAEVREVLGHRQPLVGRDEEAVRLTGGLMPVPEHLGERDVRAVPAVGEHSEDDRVGTAGISQTHWA
jgi:hypothetical protein